MSDKPQVVEVLRVNDDGIHMRIYDTEYCYVKATKLYHRKINGGKWLPYEPSVKILPMITEKWGDYWEKVNREKKRAQAEAFHDKFPDYQNNRKQQSNVMAGLGTSRFAKR